MRKATVSLLIFALTAAITYSLASVKTASASNGASSQCSIEENVTP